MEIQCSPNMHGELGPTGREEGKKGDGGSRREVEG